MVISFSLIFTIQNVPIKYSKGRMRTGNEINLQYKMFLLNGILKDYRAKCRCIYNTKCSY